MSQKKPVSKEDVIARIALMKKVRLIEIVAAAVLIILMAAGKVSQELFVSIGILLFVAILGGTIAISKMQAEVGR